ncbi:MAG: hypothetical protein AB7L92_07090, partial [Alphaproteobacteria bacterium]
MTDFLSFFKNLRSPKVMPQDDPDFGKISYYGEETGIWQTHSIIEDPGNHAKYSFTAIPGDHKGPFAESRSFLLRKNANLPALWSLCTPTLEEVCDQFKDSGLKKPVTETFLLADIALEDPFENSGQWSVGFETKTDFWLY